MQINLISSQLSPCCGSEAKIVRSRQGGFVSRNCLKCGAPHYLKESQIPIIYCRSCNTPMRIDKLDGTNYFYECPICKQYHKIADIVPPWNEEFRYSGLAAYGELGPPY